MSDKKQDEATGADVIEGEILEEKESPAEEPARSHRSRAGLIGILLLAAILVALYLWARAAGRLPEFGSEKPAPVAAEAPITTEIPENVRIAAVEEGLVNAETRDAELGERLAAVERRLDAIENAPSGEQTQTSTTEGDAAATSDLEQRIAALEARLQEMTTASAPGAQTSEASQDISGTLSTIENRLAALEANGRQRADFAARAARVAIAVYAGHAFDAEVIALRDAARGLNAVDQAVAGPHIATLVELAPKGTASLAALSERFDELAGEALRAEADAGADEGFWAGVKAKLSELITIRRRGSAPAQSTDAQLNAIADDLEKGDPAAALTAAEAVSGPAADVLAPFVAELRNTIAARNAVDALIALSEGGAAQEGGSDSP